MAWTDWIGPVIGLVGSALDYKNADSPDAPEQLSYDEIINLMMQNSQSPWGNTTWTEGADGRFSSAYEFNPDQQAVWDRGIQRSLNPDQAYQMPGQLQQLQQALMNSRLGGMGIQGDPGYNINTQGSGGSQNNTNFTVPVGAG